MILSPFGGPLAGGSSTDEKGHLKDWFDSSSTGTFRNVNRFDRSDMLFLGLAFSDEALASVRRA